MEIALLLVDYPRIAIFCYSRAIDVINAGAPEREQHSHSIQHVDVVDHLTRPPASIDRILILTLTSAPNRYVQDPEEELFSDMSSSYPYIARAT
jgi:hypothetical protein